MHGADIASEAGDYVRPHFRRGSEARPCCRFALILVVMRAAAVTASVTAAGGAPTDVGKCW